MSQDVPPATVTPPTPERIFEIAWGLAGTRALATAVELDVFSHVAAGRRTVEALAQATKASERGMRMLVDAMVALGFLARGGAAEPSALTLAPDAQAFLVRSSPAYLGEFLGFFAKDIDENWRHLTRSIATGTPVVALDRPAEGVPLWHALVDSLFPMGFRAATQLGEELGRRRPGQALRLLDVAAGSGVWGIGVATTNRNVRVTAHDLPETLDHARQWVARRDLGSRFEFLAGDIRTIDFGERTYDAAVLGHILHSEGPVHAPRLLAKMARALRPGGTLAIAEFVPADDRSGPPQALFFALNMLVHTTDGDAFTLARYREWLGAVGFEDVVELPAASASPLILATRSRT